ncbi:hypothetical protein CDG76_12840 [Nostoc sp. 'Peltigera membranacea cyanobiont' 210A]|uniref:two-partner secretion domain-containing protein n=1 Tax=Nostoc sp. 'Peltigera membranacea cyanobiont' 210A TaxID=2014529 RepID=UPI000B9585FC|nr:filamentous hemagglutinin N-terminal domain-containing protein [Nostoc sp. 'Peltigera membranacea cyanobiont' 210A]OYD95804.1 hypothetical protein CDG76_12840 [Nostoc sp. 'Peltigera membranacea cyanobiont' 210A]
MSFKTAPNWLQGLGVAIVSAVTLYANISVAQITPDGTLPNNSSVKLEGNTRIIEGGTIRGGNLFHSFGEFSVLNGSTTLFNNSLDIQNILTRVTGKSISNIDGLIRANGKANLFLLNPNGIIFGQNARLDIGGSFSATTASSFKFTNGSTFSATNPQAPPLLAVNITPGLQYGASQSGATVTNTGNLAPLQDLTLVADKLDLQGQLKAGRNLTLQAQDTVKVRDSVKTPFLAQAGGNLTIGGNQGIDILALNHPTRTSFVSGGDFSLISDGIISGDARFASGGNFSLKSVSGGLANFVSLYDPIISSNGDVDVAANYTGASLLVESKGNIRFQGDIDITRPDTSILPVGQDTATLSKSTALIMRSGQNTLAYGAINSGLVPAFSSGTLPEGITIDGNVRLQPFNGAGGLVSLTTASGDVSTKEITTNGGAIAINSAEAIKTNGQNLVTLNGANNAGDISLKATNGNINTNILFSYSRSDSGNTANGGNISLEATNGSITTAGLFSYSYSESGSTRNGGEIALLAANDIITRNFFSGSRSNSSGSAGNGGKISLKTTNGTIHTRDLVSESYSTNSGSRGNGGAIAFTTNGNITTGSMNSEVRGTGNSGDINLTADSLFLTDARLSTSTFGQGNGGTVNITASDTVSLKNTASIMSNVGSTAIGKGGDINITTGSLSIQGNSRLTSSTNGKGDAGSINIIARNTVSLKNEAFVVNDVGNTAIGKGGDINITTGSLSIQGNSLLTSSTNGTGDAGSINIIARNTVSLEDRDVDQYFTGLSSVAGNGSVGKGGNIYIQAEHLSIKNNAAINADVEPTARGNGGNINLDIKGTILFTTDETYNKKGELARITLGVQPEGIGSGGTLIIKAGSLVLRNSGIIKASTQGQGNAGNIEVNADVVDISGSVPTSGLPSGLLTSTNTAGKAGDIIIDTQTFRIADGAALSARTKGDGQGGSITVNATKTFEAINGGQLVSTTSGKGEAGNIFVNATDRLTISGTDINYSDRIAKFPNNNQLVANDIKEGAASGLIVNSTGLANAGNIEATAGFIHLDNQGRITAESASAGNGGNITLNVGKLLLLRRGNSSQISTTAGTANAGGDGGNITINAPNGFLVAVPRENSDITANAFEGRGGNINIKALNVLGIRRQEQQTPQSEITASSELGINGNIEITTPDIDPSSGLVELPVNLVDVSQQISTACTPGTRQFQNTFVATGRGGLPMSPTEPLQDSSTVSAWVKLRPKSENLANTTPVPEPTAVSTTPIAATIPIVEASGWVIDRKGNIKLVAQVPQLNPHSPWQTPASCPVSQGGVKYGKTSAAKASS